MKKLYQTILVFVLFGALSSVYFKSFAAVGTPCDNNPDGTGQNACGTGANGCDVGERCKLVTTTYTCQADTNCTATPGSCSPGMIGICGTAAGCASADDVCIQTGTTTLVYTCSKDANYCIAHSGSCTKVGSCGALGGCPFDQRCESIKPALTTNATMYMKCKVSDPTCKPTDATCDASKVGACGIGGTTSCPIGSMCVKQGASTYVCMSGSVDPNITLACGNTEGLGRACTSAQAAMSACGPEVGCEYGETCRLSGGTTRCVLSTNSPNCEPRDCNKGGCKSPNQQCVLYNGSYFCNAVNEVKTNLPFGASCNSNPECASQYCNVNCDCKGVGDEVTSDAQCCSLPVKTISGPTPRRVCGANTTCGGTGCRTADQTCTDIGQCQSEQEPAGSGNYVAYECLPAPVPGDQTRHTCQKLVSNSSCKGTLGPGSVCTNPNGCQCASGQCIDAGGGKRVCLDPHAVLKAGVLQITKIDNFENLVTLIFGIVVPFALALGVALTAKAGYKIKMSQGNPQEINAAIEELWHAIVGTAVVLLAMVLIRVMINALLGPTTI